MWAVIKKEFKTYFLSPIGYVVIGIILLFYSLFFSYIIFETRMYGDPSINFSYLYAYIAEWGLSISVPILTMRMFAEERKNGTEQLFLTSPTSIIKVIFGKMLAALGVIGITLLISFGYYAIISCFVTTSIVPVLVAIFGFILVSFAAISFGMFISSITENQVISAIITIAFFIITFFIGTNYPIISDFSLMSFYEKFPSGVISWNEVAGLVSFTILFTSLTILVMQRRKSVK